MLGLSVFNKKKMIGCGIKHFFPCNCVMLNFDVDSFDATMSISQYRMIDAFSLGAKGSNCILLSLVVKPFCLLTDELHTGDM